MSRKQSTISKNIRKLRKEKGLSQDRLSKLANVAFHTIVKIESGETSNPTIKTIEKISQALNISIDQLMKNNYLHLPWHRLLPAISPVLHLWPWQPGVLLLVLSTKILSKCQYFDS